MNVIQCMLFSAAMGFSAPGFAEPEKPKGTVWEITSLQENGEVYSFDPASIKSVTYENKQVNTVTMTVDNFKGHPDADHLWAQVAVLCEKPAYRMVLAIGSKANSQELITMPSTPAGRWSLAKDGTPMAAIMKKSCL
jgi:hypothetical protein